MLNQNGGSRMDTVFKLTLIFLISVLSFAIGAFVGKQVSDTEHREAMLETEASPNRATASIDGDAGMDEPKTALSEEDIASLTEEFVKAEKKEMEKAKEMPNPVQKVDIKEQFETGALDDGYKKFGEPAAKLPEKKKYEKAKDKQRVVADAGDRVAQGLPPRKDPPKVRKPDAMLPTAATSSVGKYTIQVGAYATEKEAQDRVGKLKGKGYSAFYITADVKSKTWYRVSVGLFPTYKNALAFQKEMADKGGVASSFVQKIVK